MPTPTSQAAESKAARMAPGCRLTNRAKRSTVTPSDRGLTAIRLLPAMSCGAGASTDYLFAERLRARQRRRVRDAELELDEVQLRVLVGVDEVGAEGDAGDQPVERVVTLGAAAGLR